MHVIHTVVDYAISLPRYVVSGFSQLSSQQKKTLAITSLAIAILTTLMIAYRCFSNRKVTVSSSSEEEGRASSPILAPKGEHKQNPSFSPLKPRLVEEMSQQKVTHAFPTSPVTKHVNELADQQPSPKGFSVTASAHLEKEDLIEDDQNEEEETLSTSPFNKGVGGNSSQQNPIHDALTSISDPTDLNSVGGYQDYAPSPPTSPFNKRVGDLFQQKTLGTQNAAPFVPTFSPVAPVALHQTQHRSDYETERLKRRPLPPELVELLKVEAKLNELGEELTCQQDILKLAQQHLASIQNKAPDQDNVEFFADSLQIEEIEDDSSLKKLLEEEKKNKSQVILLKSELKQILDSYPTIFRTYLEKQFANPKKNDHEIFEHITTFTGLMLTYQEHLPFVQEGLKQIDLFLDNTFFTSKNEACLQEEKKIDLIVFHEFFSVINQHFHVIREAYPQLAINLKIKLANLPLIDEIDRAKAYPHIYLSAKDQLNILIQHFQQQEEAAVDSIIRNLRSINFRQKELKKLAKCVVESQSSLCKSNVIKLQAALSDHMQNQAPVVWDNSEQVYDHFRQFFQSSINQNSYYSYHQSTEVSDLRKASIARQFFANQQGLEEDKIQILRWYHATNQENLLPIIRTGEIEVRHQRAYAGAWVSSQRENSMGSCVFVFDQRIPRIDPDVFIGFEKGKVRWRGLKNAIRLMGPESLPHLILMGLVKTTEKIDKLPLIEALKQHGIEPIKIVSNAQIDYMQQEVLRIIGNPNLTEKWWGKGDVNKIGEPPSRFDV